MTAEATVVHRERAFIALSEITFQPDFISRNGPQDRAHVRTLAQAVKNHGPLDPVILWRNGETLVLLDGAYRIAAYRAAAWRDAIPAYVVSCDRRTALLLAAGANSKDKASLTQNEKADLAWRLVREPGMDFSKPEIARATGISSATVGRMRARHKALLKRANVELTGHWWRDRSDDWDEQPEGPAMSDGQRRKAINQLVNELRNLLDWRKPGAITRDSTAVFEALYEALGTKAARFFADWAVGGEGDDGEEWSSFDLDTEPPASEDDDSSPF
ncbi:ParB N-terminal domain-containing protein [Rhizobium sp. CECT 9324]|uniref:ParB N-terminal domain-containing protein n=1 Tax=Rhizobium sp. CECT 9324 TaxID=2845820 RepID=UPI001E36446F|nr:ParB N-terminal domain-containing protein [Rhizobium sp. CECT 9324]CAH0338928.1 hypothetical protein RHI9324_00563 [Rhizobium sp. CECT 9324]